MSSITFTGIYYKHIQYYICYQGSKGFQYFLPHIFSFQWQSNGILPVSHQAITIYKARNATKGIFHEIGAFFY